MKRDEIIKLYEESRRKFIEKIPTEIENLRKVLEEAAGKTARTVIYPSHPDITPSLIEFLEEEEWDYDVEENIYGDTIYVSFCKETIKEIGFHAIQKNRQEKIQQEKRWVEILS